MNTTFYTHILLIVRDNRTGAVNHNLFMCIVYFQFYAINERKQRMTSLVNKMKFRIYRVSIELTKSCVVFSVEHSNVRKQFFFIPDSTFIAISDSSWFSIPPKIVGIIFLSFIGVKEIYSTIFYIYIEQITHRKYPRRE